MHCARGIRHAFTHVPHLPVLHAHAPAPGFALSCFTLASTLEPSVMRNLITALAGALATAAAATAGPPLAGTFMPWCSPTNDVSCRPGSRGLLAAPAAAAAAAAPGLSCTSTKLGAYLGAWFGGPVMVAGWGVLRAAAPG